MNVLDRIEKETNKRYRSLKKAFEKLVIQCRDWNDKKYRDFDIPTHIGSKIRFCLNSETDDCNGTQEEISIDGWNLWMYNSWIGASRFPEGAEIVNGRYPVKHAAIWFTPFCYNNGYSAKKLFVESETEKVLFKDYNVKISLTRNYAIPQFHSCQWRPRMDDVKFSFFVLLRDEEIAERNQGKIIEINQKISELRKTCTEENEIDLLKQEKTNLYNEMYYWHKCFDADTLKKLFIKARYHFNDWRDD